MGQVSHAKRILPYNAGTYDRICKHIAQNVAKVGLEGVTHHALRATAMELSDQGEELKASDRSSKNLGTTARNKQEFYVRKSHGRTFCLRADGLSQSLSGVARSGNGSGSGGAEDAGGRPLGIHQGHG